jgi:uncharacterized protein with GYD domain
MATYITTIKFTDPGIKAIHETTKRAASVKATAKKFGVKVRDIYWTLGTYDGLLICEAPDDEAVTAALLQIGSAGYVHTSTVRAFNAAEMDKVLARMGG